MRHTITITSGTINAPAYVVDDGSDLSGAIERAFGRKNSGRAMLTWQGAHNGEKRLTVVNRFGAVIATCTLLATHA